MYESKRKPQAGLKYYPTATERDDIIPNLGEAAYVLYSAYLTRQHNVSYSDKAMQRIFPYWKVTKIKRLRLALTKAGYFDSETFPKNVAGTQIVLTTIGKKKFEADKL